LLYIDKKKTEPIWTGQGFRQVYQHFPDRSIRLPDGLRHSLKAGPTTDVSGFLPENITRYQEAVKKKFPERFTPSGERILYQSNENSQLSLGFAQPPEMPEVKLCYATFGDTTTPLWLSEKEIDKNKGRIDIIIDKEGRVFAGEKEIETAKKAGYVQGVCESAAAVSSEKNMAVKLLSEMNVTKDTAKKFANPETYKTLEKGVFARKQEQKIEQTRKWKL